MNICPTCRENLRSFIKLRDDGTYESWVEIRNARESMLRDALIRYWRWIAEGKVTHGPSSGEKVQYFYDPYRSSMRFDLETGRYHFDIQTYDSPDGDTWWRGSFRISGALIIEDIKGRETGE